MLEKLILLLSLVPPIHGQWDNDICVIRSQDGHSNEQETISKEHCEFYDRLHHNGQDTLQSIDLDGTIAGCWVYETETEERFYYNTNLNPSGRINTAPTLRGPLVPPAVTCLTDVS